MNTTITITVISAIVVLAAGGLSQVYAQANNPPTANNFTIITTDGLDPIDMRMENKYARVNLAETGHVSDPDQDDDTLTVTISRDPTQGWVNVNAENTITYQEDVINTISRSDTFEYTVTDDDGNTATGEVTVVILNRPPLAFSQNNIMVTAGATKEIAIYAEDDGPGVDDLQLAITTEPTRGTIEVTGFTISYTAGEDVGPDTIEYTLTDFFGATFEGTININIEKPRGPNPPTATDFAIYVAQSERFVIDLDGKCRVTDEFPDALRLTIERVPPQTQGTAVVDLDLAIVYTANDDAMGTDRIRYTVTDDEDESATGLITINPMDAPPNTPPTAADFAVNVDTGASVTIDLSENSCIYDPDDDTLDITITGQSSKGTASINGTVITYIADAAAATEADTIIYNVSDGRGGNATGTITVNLMEAPPNMPPTATDSTVNVDAGASVTIDLLGNISDPDDDTLDITITGQPSRGTASVNGTVITYAADATGATGADTIVYIVSDGQGDTATGTITVNVAGAASANRNPTVPQIISVGYAVADETVINLKAIISDPDGDELIITITGQPSKGTATVRGTMIVYTPDEGAIGIDRVNYEVSDGQGGTATGTITVNVAGAAGGPGGPGGTLGTVGPGGTVGTGGPGGPGGTLGTVGPDGAGGYTLEETGLTPQTDARLSDDEVPSDAAPSRTCAR